MNILGRTFTSPITLLPLDSFQRHMLAGTTGLLVWIVTSVWNWGDRFDYREGWNSSFERPIIEGIVDHLDQVVYDLFRLFYSPNVEWSEQWFNGIRELLITILYMLPTITSVAMLISSCLILLGAFRIITYPDRLRKVAPVILGAAVMFIVAVQVFAYPVNSVTALLFPEYPSAPPKITFVVSIWIDDIVDTAIDLLVPVAVLLISLVPIFSPEKKAAKRT
jgi:hypothetical protein